MNRDRFRFFSVMYHESDLLIGVKHTDYTGEMIRVAEQELVRLRELILQYDTVDPMFRSSLEPLEMPSGISGVPAEIATMIRCGLQAGTGPMAAVAGLFAASAGSRLIETYGLNEVVVENGGDLYIKNESELVSVIHAGSSPLSDKLAFMIPPGEWGVCTSSGVFGHSFSRGKANAVSVIARSAPLSDAWATSLANRVSLPEHIAPVLEQAGQIPEILGCAIIVGDQVGVRGAFELKLLS